MGVVIGEIIEIGDDVIIYYGVILGGMGKFKGKRYFILGNWVVVGVGVKVLGVICVGDDVRIGVNVVVFLDLFMGFMVVGVKVKIIIKDC